MPVNNAPFYTLSQKQKEERLAAKKTKKKLKSKRQKAAKKAREEALAAPAEVTVVESAKVEVTPPAEPIAVNVVTPSIAVIAVEGETQTIAEFAPITTPDYVVPLEEFEFRKRGEAHRRLMRRPKPPISIERGNELCKLVFTEGKQVAPEHALDLRLAVANGILVERDMTALTTAEAKRERKRNERQAPVDPNSQTQ